MTAPTFCDIFETPFGWMGLVATSSGLTRTTLPERSPEVCVSELADEIDRAAMEPERFTALRERLDRYFRGDRVSFEEERIDVEGVSPFLKAAWDACRTIPYGQTRSYKWLAGMAGKPAAPRAAGQAMARNRLPIVVPCHRIIGSDGRLRGFGRGITRLDLKRDLLELETIQLTSSDSGALEGQPRLA